jgi:hypothetical protein
MDANLVEKLDLKHCCFGKALLLEWRNGKRVVMLVLQNMGKSKYSGITDRFIGDRITAKKQRLKKE